MSRILIVDDEEAICWGLRRLLTEEGYQAEVASSAEEALVAVAKNCPDLVVMDVRLPGMDGLTALRKLREMAGAIPVVIITAFGNLQTAVAAVRDGAVEYLTKPFELEEAVLVVRRTLQRSAAKPVSDDDEGGTGGEKSASDELLGTSAAMQKVFRQIALVVPTDVSVLITGESGTGKELVARAIHRHSLRAGKPLVPIHLAALSPSLIESELFGHAKGAFTGADQARQGLLELAHEATVFFDEAGDIPLPVQVKLLRVLEQREVTPVGETRTRSTDFRVIAATNRQLSGAIEEGSFRADLFYRLAGFEIVLPPLRERVEDIPLLAGQFLAHSRVLRRENSGFTESAMLELCQRSWPGNVRELRSAVEHGSLMAGGGLIGPEHLPPLKVAQTPRVTVSEHTLDQVVRAWAQAQLAAAPVATNLYEKFLAEVEPPLFQTVLDRSLQNRTAAADILGIHRATLRKRLS